MREYVEEIAKDLRQKLTVVYNKKKDQLIIFTFCAVFLLYMRVNPLFPYYFTDRKIYFLCFLIFFIIFKMSSKAIAGIGLLLLVFISFLSFLGKIGFVDKIIVYSWGFFVVSLVFMGIELWRKKEQE